MVHLIFAPFSNFFTLLIFSGGLVFRSESDEWNATDFPAFSPLHTTQITIHYKFMLSNIYHDDVIFDKWNFVSGDR